MFQNHFLSHTVSYGVFKYFIGMFLHLDEDWSTLIIFKKKALTFEFTRTIPFVMENDYWSPF